ncbi:MAG: nucleotidyl transferase AbiEii/AbiGii toxin family protein [Bacteroidales bacterium]|nr:nucleotidyl transferase AbiEii/AbiGii toxin family protein [Bacteroidales bacterium]
MIKDKCFTEDWLDQFKKQKDHKRIDKIILEKLIYALHLLEMLKANGLNFVFKGGTSLVLLLKEGNRFSIDLDIVCKTARKDLEEILNKVIETSRFTEWKLDEHRSYQPGVPKAHYVFIFDTKRHGSGTILLDVLIEDSIYPQQVEMPINAKWIETEAETMVIVPTINAITGDKLTAFAPNTIGIPWFKGKDKQPFSMEICKQLFDLSKLFERIESIEMVAKSYAAFTEHEINYRKNGDPENTITPEMVLKDTIDTCLIIAKRGGGSDDEKKMFEELQRGIKAFDFGFLMSGHFRIDDAIPATARIAFLAAKILVNDLTPIAYYEGQDIRELNIEDPNWNFLNKLKKQPDKSSFYYWHQTLKLLSEVKNGHED